MQRRRVIASAAAALALPGLAGRAFAADAGVTDQEVVLGQSAILSGPLGSAVQSFTAGALLHFDELNAKGGIAGRRLKLVSLDDELKPDRAVENYKALLAEHKVFAFFGGVGSGTTAAIAGLLRESNAPLIGNYAVSDSAREKAQGGAYFVRATYGREAEKLVQHLATIGITRIGVATLDNPGGAEVLALVRKAVLKEGQAKDVAVAVGMKTDGSNIVDMGKTLAAAQPQAVIIFVSGPPVAKLMSTMWEMGSSPAFYGMSVVSGDATAKQLGGKLRGLATSQVVPYPWSEAEPVARSFRTLATEKKASINYITYEGYLNAMVVAEGLRRCGRDLRRDTLHREMQRLRTRVASMDVDFTGGSATGSRFVDLVHVTAEGRFLR